MTGALPLRVAARYYQAGIIEPPPKLAKEVQKQVLNLVFEHYWAALEVQLQKVSKWLKDPTKQERHAEYREKIVEAHEGIRFCKKYASKPQKHKTLTAFKVPVDLSGWKYLRGTDAEARQAVEQRFRNIRVEVSFDARAADSGAWYPEGGLEVFAPPYAASTATLKRTLHTLLEVLRHELRHAAQSFLSLLKDVPERGGLPSPKVRTETKAPGKKEPTWALLDVEFQPIIGDAIHELGDYLKRVPRQHRADVFKVYVGEKHSEKLPEGWDRFVGRDLLSIKKKAPQKWKAAVAEVYKGVRNLL